MEKWKIGVIALLLAGFAGFAATQNKPPIANPEAQPTSTTAPGEPVPTPTLEPKIASLIGQAPPTWNIPANLWTNTEKPLTPADLKNRVTLLEFFRIGCPHCEEAVPFIEAMKNEYGPHGLQIITLQSPGLLTDPSNPELKWDAVKAWIKDHKITYPAGFDTDRKVKNQTGIETYPLSLVIGRDGKIAYAQTGHTTEKAQQLAAKIESIMRGTLN